MTPRVRRRPPLPTDLNPASCDLTALLTRLSLPTVRRLLPETERTAIDQQLSHREFLAHLIVGEVLNRDQTRVQRLIRAARFPFIKTIDDFTFAPKGGVRRDLIAPYLANDYVASGRNLVLSGKPGRGKTHLAIAIAIKAIQDGSDARFIIAAHLIDDLTAAARAGRLQEKAEPFIAAKVLIIDELGYLPHAQDAANVLYTIIDARYIRRRPTIFTTNKPLRQWGNVLHDTDLAEALLDRIMEQGRHVELTGRSWRTGRDDASVESAPDPVTAPAAR
jgi:DNA replication protein DnaC